MKFKMKFSKKLITSIFCVILSVITFVTPMTASATTTTYKQYSGLSSTNGYYYYYKNSSKYSSWTNLLTYSSNGTVEGAVPLDFSDLNESTTVTTYGEYLYYLTNLNSFMSGTSTTYFKPNNNLTVAQTLTILYKMAGSPSLSSSVLKNNPFKDISTSCSYYKAARWAYKKGIITTTTVNGSSKITRERLATMLYRFEGEPSVSASKLNKFKSSTNDYYTISSWAKKAMCWCYNNGYLSRSSKKNINPSGTITRIKATKTFGEYGMDENIGALCCAHITTKKSSKTVSITYSSKTKKFTVYYCKSCGVLGVSSDISPTAVGDDAESLGAFATILKALFA